jgi:hypothetical protein
VSTLLLGLGVLALLWGGAIALIAIGQAKYAHVVGAPGGLLLYYAGAAVLMFLGLGLWAMTRR